VLHWLAGSFLATAAGEADTVIKRPRKKKTKRLETRESISGRAERISVAD